MLDQFAQAAEIIKNSHFVQDNITTEDIQGELNNYLENLIEEINNEPLFFLKEEHRFWSKLDTICLRKAENQQIQKAA